MSETTNIRPPDPVDWAKFSDGGSGKTLPPKGEYLVVPTAIEMGRTKEGYLNATIDVVVQAPNQPWDGYLARFNRFNTKKWPGRESNGLADYLFAQGVDAKRYTTDQEYEQATLNTIHRPFRALLDWEAYDGATQFNLKGMDAFPTNNQTGKKETSVMHNGQKIFANVRIKYPIVQKSS